MTFNKNMLKLFVLIYILLDSVKAAKDNKQTHLQEHSQ